MKYYDYKIKNNEVNLNLIGKIRVKLLVITALMVFTLIFAQLVFASSLAVDGQRLSKIEEQIKSLEAENTTLKVEIAKESALSNLAQKAEAKGFKKPKEIIIPN